MRYDIAIEVSTRDGVLNPESKAILQALQGHDFAVSKLTMNKRFYLTLEAKDKVEAESLAKEMCEDFLANPIIQDYTIEVQEA
ncbi:phosphoribosylformylglycinamidine synthase subunit PurS [Helicobacter bilis]|uniref:Phosphoribosylformylglycinamidine synthase subunit PurS n=2 Tax=Helicobacter bilis TaxID=37372 RepID=A0A6D2CGI7_9HELI|nr:phosphoribosylformylglycinamidine synthase subunit PurS [Helicobacter bilis]EMZ39933.1 phosphoribosylformylglycinamidine synthase, purS protein [Helicobacter bilis WiWa]TLE06116.1 phosphoribosylformylglycinamidine synthase, purS protein [Helicobacter bilis]TLE06924.1 phosphoribosylformylglycinamidine synthase, purS protein [Helicobacter bilis]